MARRWVKIGAGLGAGITTILTLFAFLTIQYGFIITDLTGDINCSGTYENPCISYFDVRNPNYYDVDIYSKDQVKLNFSPEIGDYALFVKDGRCSATGSCRCELKDGRMIGFKGWRCTDFTNKTKPRKDRVYNFRFPSYTTKNFMLAGIKKSPFDTVKWTFGTGNGILDPIWKGVQIDLELIENTDYCFQNCSLRFKFRVDKTLQVNKLSDFKGKFVKAIGASDLLDWGFRLGRDVSYNDSRWISDMSCNFYNETLSNGTIEEHANCTDNSYFNITERIKMVYNDFNPLGKTIQKDKWYHIELWGTKQPKGGDVDAVPSLWGFDLPFAWWLDYTYKREDLAQCPACSANVTSAFLVNDTAFYLNGEPQYVWVNHTVAQTTHTAFDMFYMDETNYTFTNPANDAEICFDVDEGNASDGCNPYGVNALGVYHLNGTDGHDSSIYNRHGSATGVITETNGKIAGGTSMDGPHPNQDYFDLGRIDGPFADLTLMAWLKVTSDSNGWTFAKVNTEAAGEFLLSYEANGDKMRAWWNDGVTGATNLFTATDSIDVNTWYFVAFTFDSDEAIIYIDGVQKAIDADPNSDLDSSAVPVYIGCGQRFLAGDGCLIGVIDEARMYNRTFSADELLAIYNNTVGTHNLSSLGGEEVGADNPPYYTEGSNSTDGTVAGTIVNHSLQWNDDNGLDGYIFEFCDGTWNGTGCDSSYKNQTDGFDIGAAGAINPRGITTNGTDFWVVDKTDGTNNFVYHFDSAGNNQTDGFTIVGGGNSGGITTNGTDFWIVDDVDNFVYHYNSSGDNQTDGFGVSGFGSGITTNGTDFWVVDLSDTHVYHYNSSGDSQADDFDITPSGIGAPVGISIAGSDFWIVDWVAEYVFHLNSTGDNQTDGFALSVAGVGEADGITMGINGTNITDLWLVDTDPDYAYHLKKLGFVNDSFVSMTGTANWSNVSKTITSTVGVNVSWRVCANDTADQWNCSAIFTYVTTSAVGDTCDTCAIDCTEDCTVDSAQECQSGFTATGAGIVQIQAEINITGAYANISLGCYFNGSGSFLR